VTQTKSLFETLYREHRPMVYQMCMGFMKGDHDMANDLSQEIFINIWNSLAGFKNESSHKTWIYRITVNTCLQQIRKEKNKKKISIDDGFDVAEPVNNTEENHIQLYKAVGQLPEVERLIMMMVLEEVEYEEISKVIGINETNLRVKIHRIKKRLKDLLEYAR
jgi:RNA polymerase sigma-70 factor (ECF subfamily)